jgi:SAM-dependent methyltransferase
MVDLIRSSIAEGGVSVKLDLGCGKLKHNGYTGVDKIWSEGVDVVCDLNRGLPFADNSATRVMASHVLEHLDDLMFIMGEIYRVCRHKAVVCILAPYAMTTLNLSNPFHKHYFTEHTPRFFTKHHDLRVPEEEYRFPFINQWGLSESENSSIKMDFRCVRMEFFYFPDYLNLPLHEKRRLRLSQWNVVDQIMYHLVAVKKPITEQQLDQIAVSSLDVPDFVHYRRTYEQSLLRG